MARCAILGRPLAANCVLIESPRAFFLEPGSDSCGGGSDLCVLRAIVAGGRGTEGASAPSLSPMGIGIVGLSGRGVLLHLLPCLYAGGTPKRWTGVGGASSCGTRSSSADRLGADRWGRRDCDRGDEVPEPSSGESFVRRLSADAQVGFPGSRFLALRRWLSGIRTLPGAAGDDRELK